MNKLYNEVTGENQEGNSSFLLKTAAVLTWFLYGTLSGGLLLWSVQNLSFTFLDNVNLTSFALMSGVFFSSCLSLAVYKKKSA